MKNCQMLRREFIKRVIPPLSTLLLSPTIFAEEQNQDFKKRQNILDKILEKNKSKFSYIKKLNYHQNPHAFFITKLLEDSKKQKQKSFTFIQLDGQRLRDSYAYVIPKQSDFGKKEKQNVHVFPKAFRLKPKELEIILFHEDVHCKDIHDGLKLKGEYFDVQRMNFGLVRDVMEVRATYETLEHLFSEASNKDMSFLKEIGINFIGQQEVEYLKAFNKLKKLFDGKNLSPYDQEVAKKHIDTPFNKWSILNQAYRKHK